jgi:hypothetical protein
MPPDMNDDTASLDLAQTPLGDLGRLVKDGVTPAALQASPSLFRMVADELEASYDVSLGVQGNLLNEVLTTVVDEQRQQAFALREDVPLKASADVPCFQVAAAGELLELTNEVIFEKYRDDRCKQMQTTWQAVKEKQDKSGRLADLRLRAALWIGRETVKSGETWQPIMLATLESAIRAHLANDEVRAALIAKYRLTSVGPVESRLGSQAAFAPVPLAATLRRALDAARSSCQARNHEFRTPHLLLALLEMPFSKASQCFEAVELGRAAWARERLGRYVANHTDEPFIEFDWKELVDIAKAQEFARQTRTLAVTDAHLLAAILAGESATVQQLAHQLGPQFERLLEITWEQCLRTGRDMTPGVVWEEPDDAPG